jgi:hypothetical protein
LFQDIHIKKFENLLLKGLKWLMGLLKQRWINFLPPGRRPYPPACKPYGLEAGPEARPYPKAKRKMTDISGFAVYVCGVKWS